MNERADVVLAIDPGRSKCGIAVASTSPDQDSPVELLHHEVIDAGDLARVVSDLAARFSPRVILIGDGTSSSEMARVVGDLAVAPVEMVDEKFTSQLARRRYFEHNPPRGIRRLIPISLQTPSRPYDDYVAVILAERYLST